MHAQLGQILDERYKQTKIKNQTKSYFQNFSLALYDSKNYKYHSTVLEVYNHGIQSHHFMANRWENNGNSDRLFLGASKSQ